MLSSNLEKTIERSLQIANKYFHEYASCEHLLLAIMSDIKVRKFCIAANANIERIILKLESYIKNQLVDFVNRKVKHSKATAGFTRIIQRAALNGQANGVRLIDCYHVFIEFFFEKTNYGFLCLDSENIKRNDVINYFLKESNKKSPYKYKDSNFLSDLRTGQNAEKNLTHDDSITFHIDTNYTNQEYNKYVENEKEHNQQLDKTNLENLNHNQDRITKENHQESVIENEERERGKESKEEAHKLSSEILKGRKILSKYAANLNEKANGKNIDKLIGRDKETQRVIEILSRRKKNNAILVGDAGVGKTAIAESLASKITSRSVPQNLFNLVIYSLDIAALVAGTKFRGEFEERIKEILNIIKNDSDIILFIDEIHTIIGAGSTIVGGLDASNLLKPALNNGELRCIGATTYQEYSKYFEKDAALVRRFQKVVINEPDEATCFDILNGIKGYYEKYHNIKYSKDSLKAAITLSNRYIHKRYLPDKAIDILDEVGARKKEENKVITIRAEDIEDLLSNMLSLPIRLDENSNMLNSLEENLKQTIFGQDNAIKNLCGYLRIASVGLKMDQKPIGSFLFSGDTGVGKTELVKQLAKFTNMNFLRLDMSEYSEKNAVTKLIGSPPGYIGSDEGGILTSEIDKYPYSVILFDEIEKADQEIYNLLLQIMDNGSIKDNSGKDIKFFNTIIVLTTNIVANKKKNPMGFDKTTKKTKPTERTNKVTTSQTNDELDLTPINNYFSPEFRNRLDKIILFNPITQDITIQIVEKNIEQLTNLLADKKVNLHVSDNVKKYFASEFFNPKEGARIFQHLIDEYISQEIADQIISGKLQNGGKVSVDISNKTQKILFKYQNSKVKAMG